MRVANADNNRRRLLVDHGLGALKYVAEKKGVGVTHEALSYLGERLKDEFTDAPYREYYEERDNSTIDRFRQGVETLSELAVSIARDNGRNYVSRSDIEAAIKIKFCSLYPFCH